MAADAETDSTTEEAMTVIGEWSPKAQAFLDELTALCAKHGVFLTTDYSTIEVRSIDDPIRDCEDIEDCTEHKECFR